MALTGNELVQVQGVDATGYPAATLQQVTTQQIANLSAGADYDVVTSLTTNGAGTITAAGVAGGILVRSGITSGTAFTDTTDTAANIIAAQPAPVRVIGLSWKFTYQNTTNAVATIAGGTGVTVSGITVVPAYSTASFLVTYTAANTLTMVGYNGPCLSYQAPGTFTANGATAVTVTDASVTANSVIIFTLKTVGGTVGAYPAVKTITAGTGFTVAATASDTSVYNYRILG